MEKRFKQKVMDQIIISAVNGSTLHIRQGKDFIVIDENLVPKIVEFIKQTYNL